MAETSFHEDRDFTRCTKCRKTITPYDNTSLASLALALSLKLPKSISLQLTTADLAATSNITAALLARRPLHCAKCGLFIELHPPLDEQPDLSAKLFICPSRKPHSYCLCHHCGLLYGVNPNSQTQPALSAQALTRTLRSKVKALKVKHAPKKPNLDEKARNAPIAQKSQKLQKSQKARSAHQNHQNHKNVKTQKQSGPEAQSKDKVTQIEHGHEHEEVEEDAAEVDEEEGDHSSSEVSASKEHVQANYHNEKLESLKRKLNELSSITGRASWPPSPSSKGLSLNLKELKDSPSAKSAATPSPPFLEIRDSGAKWKLLQQEQLQDTKHKLKAQSQRLQELEEMQRKMSRRHKVDREQLVKLLRSGQYPGAGRSAGSAGKPRQ